MNILFLFDAPFSPNRGGIERVSSILADKFRNFGYNVTFLSISEPDGEYDSDPTRHYIDPKDSNLISTLENFIDNQNIDVLINQSKNPQIINLLGSIDKKDLKILSVLHNQPFPTFQKERIFKKRERPTGFKGKLLKYLAIFSPAVYRLGRTRFEKNQFNRTLSFSHKLIFLSQRYIPRVVSLMPDIDPNKLISINNPNTFSISGTKDNPKENIILFLGRMIDPQKNVKTFIDVWNIFHKLHPDWRAIIVGDGPHKNIFEKYASKSRSVNLEFVGNKKNVADYYSKAKFFCMTSLYEGWPMVLNECMSYGCVPVVFNTFEACEDIIENNVNGILISQINPELMASEINRLANNEKLREKMAEEGKKKIAKFDIDIISRQWNDLFSEFS